jgi:hypothetical protein
MEKAGNDRLAALKLSMHGGIIHFTLNLSYF